MILVVGAEKGGVGKSSVAVGLAALAAGRGVDTLLLDTDPTGSSTGWCKIRDEDGIKPRLNVLTLSVNPVATLADLAGRHELIVVDIGARSYRSLFDAALIADLVIVPTTPGQFEADSTKQTFDAFRLLDQRHKNGHIPAHVLLNMLPTNSRSSEESDLRSLLADDYGLPVMRASLRQRKAWRDASKSGMAVTEMRSGEAAAKAAEELIAVYDEAENLVS